MIGELRISGLGVIDSAEVRLGDRFTVLTGETGAGKTMVLTALSMLMGARPPAGLVRGDRARVEGRWRLAADDSTIAAVVSEAGGELDGDELLLARVVPADGRARAFVGGAGVPAAVLADVAAELVAVHGQSDQLRLRQPARQRALLDAYAGESLQALSSHYRQLFAEHAAVDAELLERTEGAAARRAEAELLTHGLAAIEAVDPQPGEDDDLRAEAERLANVEELALACASAHGAVSGDDGDDALSRIAGAARLLERAGTHDQELAALAARFHECAELLADAAADLSGYAESLDADPGRLAWVHQRRSDLARLTRTYGPTVDDVLAWAAEAGPRLADIEGDDGRIEELTAARTALRVELAEAAEAMSRERTRAAATLAARVSEELTGLAMPDAELSIALTRLPDPAGLAVGDATVAFTADGIDQVQFLLAPHRGATPAPLGSGASGGELSRVMLALEVALAGVDAVGTMIFDEVDAGVGGRAAVEIGRRLARLAEHTQVIVVTHLPQVAAFADTHLVVSKDSDGAVTSSDVKAVTGQERRRELARMLAGHADSSHALAHADELLELGRAQAQRAHKT